MKIQRKHLLVGLFVAASVVLAIVGIQRSHYHQTRDQRALEETHRILKQELGRAQEERRQLLEDIMQDFRR